MQISVQDSAFDFGAEASAFQARQSASGAIVTFSGIVRDVDSGLTLMEVEHYPGMTQKALTQIAQEAQSRWTLEDVLVIHRYGIMHVGDQIMMVATAARHRKDAFEAAEFLMDYLKSRAPFWKNEVSGAGTHWVPSRDEDEAALERW